MARRAGANGIWCAVGFAGLCLAGCAADRPSRGAAPTGDGAIAPAAGVRLVDLDGAPRDLWPPRGNPVTVVLFTRTDCPVSNRYAPEIRNLYTRYHGAGVEFYLVYVDPLEDAAAIRRHLNEYRYPCPGLRDPEHALVALCGATVTPEAAVFDRGRAMTYRGRISDLYVDLGSRRPEATRHDLAEAIDAAVNGMPAPVARTVAVGCVIADVKR